MENKFNDFCKSKKCEEYIEVGMEGGICICCKKIGMSYDITEYPKDCNFIDEIVSFKSKCKHEYTTNYCNSDGSYSHTVCDDCFETIDI